MRESHQSYCRICGAQCGMVVETENNKIVSIASDKQHPISAGYLCYKGVSCQELYNGEGRLLSAKKRLESGEQVDIDTPAALDEIHSKLAALIDRYGPECVAIYYGTGANINTLFHATLKPWQKLIGTPWLFSSMTIDQSGKWVTASRMGMFITGSQVYDSDGALLLVGANPVVSHSTQTPFPIPNVQKWIKKAQKNGVKLVVIDPRKTEVARLADIHLQIVPGEDAPLLASLIHCIFENEWEDKAFCERFVQSVETLKQSVQPFAPERVAERVGVPAEQIREAAEAFATAPQRSASSSTGIGLTANSNLADHLLQCLAAVTGAYRRAGDTIANTGAFFHGLPAQEMVIPPNRSWEQGKKLPASGAGILFGEYPTSRLPDEILSDDEATRIRALIVMGGNPVSAIGDPDKTLKAFEHLDLLVTVDPAVTKTTELSHYAIPAALPYERHDFNGVLEGATIESFAQITKPVMAAPANALEDWQFFWEMAKRMGKTMTVRQPVFGGDPDPSLPVLELDMENRPDTADIIKWFCSFRDRSYEDIASRPEGVKIPGEPAVISEADPDNQARLDVCPQDVEDELAAVADSLQAATNADFPYRLASRRFLETMNSAYANNSRTRNRYEYNPVFINPEDMAAEGLKDGAKVRVVSSTGDVTGRVKGDRTLRRGVISITHMWGEPDQTGSDDCYSGHLVSLDKDLQDINFMPLFSAVPVAIEQA